MSVLTKLKNCKHLNTNAYDYVRNDGILSEIVSSDDYGHRQDLKGHMTGMRFCLDCGASQRYKLRDPLGILQKPEEREPWMIPWIWRINAN